METLLEKEKASKNLTKPFLSKADRKNSKLDIEELKALQDKYFDSLKNDEE